MFMRIFYNDISAVINNIRIIASCSFIYIYIYMCTSVDFEFSYFDCACRSVVQNVVRAFTPRAIPIHHIEISATIRARARTKIIMIIFRDRISHYMYVTYCILYTAYFFLFRRTFIYLVFYCLKKNKDRYV